MSNLSSTTAPALHFLSSIELERTTQGTCPPFVEFRDHSESKSNNPSAIHVMGKSTWHAASRPQARVPVSPAEQAGISNAIFEESCQSASGIHHYSMDVRSSNANLTVMQSYLLWVRHEMRDNAMPALSLKFSDYDCTLPSKQRV